MNYQKETHMPSCEYSLSQLKASISGFRGIVGEGLTPELVLHLAAVFADFCGPGTIMLGRDSRPSGIVFRHAVLAGLLSRGNDVVDMGIVPTPSVGFAVRKHNARGAINLTASHNPSQWNALKLYGPDGGFITPDMLGDILERHERGTPACATHDRFGSLKRAPEAWKEHVQQALEQVDVQRIRKQNYRIAVDGCRGAGSTALPFLLAELGCEVVELDCIPDGAFTRICEPSVENLGALCKIVKDKQCHLGLAMDPDADRLALVDESGIAIGEEYSLALATLAIFARGGRKVVANLSTSRMIDDLAGQFDGEVVRTSIGEAHVVASIKEQKADIGGEGNGGIIWPAVHCGRDTIGGSALLLDYMAEKQVTLSQLAASIPSYYMDKRRVEIPADKIESLLEKTKQMYPDATINTQDGIKLDFPDRWLHVRPSNTEPIVRIIAEAPSQIDTDKLCQPIIDYAQVLNR
jgi:phosphomannomutase